MTELDIDAIEARAAAATPGPWKIGTTGGLTITILPSGGEEMLRMTRENHLALKAPDTEFIAAARTDVPALCAEVRWLRAQVETLQKQGE